MRTITLTTLDFAKADGAVVLERQNVPPCPNEVSDGVVDIGSERWRFFAGSLVTYIRYGDRSPPNDKPARFLAVWQAHV